MRKDDDKLTTSCHTPQDCVVECKRTSFFSNQWPHFDASLLCWQWAVALLSSSYRCFSDLVIWCPSNSCIAKLIKNYCVCVCVCVPYSDVADYCWFVGVGTSKWIVRHLPHCCGDGRTWVTRRCLLWWRKSCRHIVQPHCQREVNMMNAASSVRESI